MEQECQRPLKRCNICQPSTERGDSLQPTRILQGTLYGTHSQNRKPLPKSYGEKRVLKAVLWLPHAPSPLTQPGREEEGEKRKKDEDWLLDNGAFPMQGARSQVQRPEGRGKCKSPSENQSAASGALWVADRALPPGSFGLLHPPPSPPQPPSSPHHP